MAKTVKVSKDFDAMRCPECGSFDVKFLYGTSDDGRTLDEDYECPDCGCKYTVTSRPVELCITKPRKKTMTWRDVRDQLNALDDAELDMEALVWTPCDFEWHSELTPIRRLDPSTDPDCAVNEDNPLSFTLVEVWED